MLFVPDYQTFIRITGSAEPAKPCTGIKLLGTKVKSKSVYMAKSKIGHWGSPSKERVQQLLTHGRFILSSKF